jgi:hypothetical protein
MIFGGELRVERLCATSSELFLMVPRERWRDGSLMVP